MMQDYRAGATIDHEHDLADRAAGCTLYCPVLVLWEQGPFSETDSPLQIWRNWAAYVEGWAIPGGLSSRKNSLRPCSTPSGHFSRVTRRPDGNATPHSSRVRSQSAATGGTGSAVIDLIFSIAKREVTFLSGTAWISFL